MSAAAVGSPTENRRTIVKPSEDAPLGAPYVRFATCVAFTQLFEYFDFYTIGFVVGIISKPWHLTFGEDATILLGTGVGTIAGSALWGWMGDRWGRRATLIASIVTFSVGTGVSALTPVGWWWMLAVFRFIVGAGSGGANTAGPPLIVEYTPARHRTLQGSLFTVALVPVGGVVTSLVVAAVGPQIGFRGLLLIGLAPVLVSFWVLRSVPESARWLSEKGRHGEARQAVARVFGERHVVSEEVADTRARRDLTYLGMLKAKRAFWSVALLWFFMDIVFAGIGLWGPTLLEQVLKIASGQAADIFIFVTLAGFVGRLWVPFVAKRFGRRRAGVFTGLCGGILLCLTGLTHIGHGTSAALFVGLLIIGYMFADGTFTNLVPFTSEIWPAELRLHGQGLGNGAGGVGKIAGPLVLAVFANSGNFVSPKATTNALLPTFLFFGGAIVLCAVVFLFLAPETNGRTLEEINHVTRDTTGGLARGAARSTNAPPTAPGTGRLR